MGRFIGKLALAASLAAALALQGCAAKPRPQVQDYDTYQIITLGSISYTTPPGWKVSERGKGSIAHVAPGLSGSPLRIAIDPHPPRDIRIDADEERRQFLQTLPGGVQQSAQYTKRGKTEAVKVMATGHDGKQPLVGSMMMLREGARTAVVSVTGPESQRVEISRAIEDLAWRIRFKK